MDEKLEKYWDEKFNELRLIWDTKHFIKIETIKLLKQIASDQRESCYKSARESISNYDGIDFMANFPATAGLNILNSICTAEIGLESKQNDPK